MHIQSHLFPQIGLTIMRPSFNVKINLYRYNLAENSDALAVLACQSPWLEMSVSQPDCTHISHKDIYSYMPTMECLHRSGFKSEVPGFTSVI